MFLYSSTSKALYDLNCVKSAIKSRPTNEQTNQSMMFLTDAQYCIQTEAVVMTTYHSATFSLPSKSAVNRLSLFIVSISSRMSGKIYNHNSILQPTVNCLYHDNQTVN